MARVRRGVADDLLYQSSTGQTPLSPDDRQTLDVMLQSSDDDAEEQFWESGGGDAIVARVASRYGLRSTGSGSDGLWWNTMTTAADLVQYYSRLLDARGGLSPDRAAIIQRPGAVHGTGRRRLPAAVRHPGWPLRRAGRSQAGLDVLHR